MTFVGVLGIVTIVLAVQFGHARWLDLRLPRRSRLPVWIRNGPSMFRRRTALYFYPSLSAFLAASLLIIAVLQDINGGPRSREEILIACAGVMAAFSLFQWLNWGLLMRWFAKGEPKI